MPINDSLQANTQHAVPQNIMDVEFKLIGELTMRQFFYIMVFAAIAYVAWSFNLPVILKWPTVIGSSLLGLGFAFVPIEDRGMDEWLVNFFSAVYAENQKLWKKEINPPSAFLHENIAMVKQELITLAPTTSRRKLEQYLLEQHDAGEQDPLDIPEQAYIEKVHAAYVTTAPAQTTVALEETLVEAPAEGETPLPDMPTGPEETLPEKPSKPQKEAKAEEIHPSQEKVTKADMVKPRPKAQKATFQIPTTESTTLTPITPDRHTGRKMTNLLASAGNIVLPIRGEKVLSIPTTPETEQNTTEKAKQLREYLEQLKVREGISLPSKPAVVPEEEPKQVEVEAEEVLKDIQAENERLMTEIEKLKADMAKAPSKPEEEKKMSLRQLIEQQTKKEETLKELEEKVQTLRPEDAPGRASSEIETETLPAPKVPNVVSGVVKNNQGIGVSGVLLIIKNAHNDPVRAIKTNALGQFSISNPLPNGAYKINIDVNKETNLTFDIIDVEAKGDIIPPLEFAGK